MKKFEDLKSIYEGKKVLITGHTGFKGSWLSIFLHSLGAEVIGISIDSKSKKGPYEACLMKNKINYDLRLDICKKETLEEIIAELKPDFIFHLAAQALVSYSYVFPVKTFMTNAIGTLNLLESIKNTKNKTVIVLITSDKCYENIETFYGYKETDSLGGKDPYSASKACAEIIANSYIRTILNKNKEHLDAAKKAVIAGCRLQESDGSWVYGLLSIQNWKDSFHTGFNLDALKTFQENTGDKSFQNNFLTLYIHS